MLSIKTFNETHSIPITLAAMCCDNSGAYEFIGLKKGFGNGFRCRYCGANKQQSQKTEIRPVFTDLDDEEYRQLFDTNGIVDKPDNRFGIELRCPISEIGSIFNLFPPDPLHDLLEGTAKDLFCQYVLSGAVKINNKSIIAKIEKFNFLNGRFKLFWQNSFQGFKLIQTKATQVIIPGVCTCD